MTVLTAHDMVVAALSTPPQVDVRPAATPAAASVAPTTPPQQHVDRPPELHIDRRATDYRPVPGFELGEAWATPEPVRFASQCPSGQNVLLRHLTPLDAIEFDLAEDVDVFTRRLQGEKSDGKRDPFWKLMRDPYDRIAFIRLLNRICAAMAVSPMIIDDGVYLVTEDGKQRIVGGAQRTNGPADLPPLPAGAVYASAVDFGDKMHIFREFDKPLSMIAPFRDADHRVEDLARNPSVGD